jgi:hypothetical protein
MLRSHPTRAAVAFHEAGHALVGLTHFGNVGAVTIRPEGRALGNAITERFMWRPEVIVALLAGGGQGAHLARSKAHQAIRWSLAGHAAEGLYTGVALRGWPDDDDVRAALAYCAAAYPGDRTLDGTLLRVETRRVRAWLWQHWEHVEALVEALLARETLTGDAVHAALGELPHPRIPRYAEDRDAPVGVPRAEIARARKRRRRRRPER